MAFLYQFLLLATLLGNLRGFSVSAQSIPRMKRAAINRTHVTFVSGDTVQRFTTTRHKPASRTDRMYYWQGQDHILRTLGAYNGYLLDGPYQLTDRSDRLLGSGTFRQGLKTGLWRKWRADGNLLSASHWRRGQQRGAAVNYDSNSQPLPTAPKSAPTKVNAPLVAAAATAHWWQLSRRKKLKAKVTSAPSAAGKQSSGGRKAKPAKAKAPPKSPEKVLVPAPAVAPPPGS